MCSAWDQVDWGQFKILINLGTTAVLFVVSTFKKKQRFIDKGEKPRMKQSGVNVIQLELKL